MQACRRFQPWGRTLGIQGNRGEGRNGLTQTPAPPFCSIKSEPRTCRRPRIARKQLCMNETEAWGRMNRWRWSRRYPVRYHPAGATRGRPAVAHPGEVERYRGRRFHHRDAEDTEIGKRQGGSVFIRPIRVHPPPISLSPRPRIRTPRSARSTEEFRAARLRHRRRGFARSSGADSGSSCCRYSAGLCRR